MSGRLHRRAGFSLVEVLVSLFIVAMGILALAGLLQAAAGDGKMSELRATATLLANDLADRMRANPAGARAAAAGYDSTPPRFPDARVSTPATCTRASPCDPPALAQADVAAWTARLRATLPNGSAWVQFRAGSDLVDVWVAWADPRALTAVVASDRSGMSCPSSWGALEPAVRCVHLAVALA